MVLINVFGMPWNCSLALLRPSNRRNWALLKLTVAAENIIYDASIGRQHRLHALNQSGCRDIVDNEGEIEMWFSRTTVMFVLVGGLVVTCLSTGVAQNSNSKPRPETSVIGFIGDSLCGLHHMRSMENETECTLTCVKAGSKFVLVDKDGHKVYTLDKSGQEKARAFAGKKVKVTGRVKKKTIYVTAIEPEA